MNYKVYSFLLFTVAFLSIFSCQQDQMTVIQEETLSVKSAFIIKMENGEHLREIKPNIYQKLIETSSRTQTLSEIENSTYTDSFSLDLNTVQVIERDTYTQYTTAVSNHAAYESYLINYLLLDFHDGSQYQYLLKYPRIITENDVVLDRANATMVRLSGDTIFQTENSHGLRPCLEGVQELVETTQEYQCTQYNCSGNNHVLGDDECDCGVTANCTPASEVCEWVVIDRWECSGGGTAGTGNGGTTGGGNDNPDNTDDDEPIETIPFIPYWQRVVDCVNDGIMGDFNNDLPLDTNDINWLQGVVGSVFANLIHRFIETNSCEASTSFIDEAVDALQENGEVDFDEKIIMDESLVNYPCQKKIIKEAYSLKTPILDLFRDIFEGEVVVTSNSGTLNVTYKTEYLGSTLYSAYTKTNLPDNIYSFKTVFNTNNLNNSTDLSIVNTTIHEAIHAVLLHYFNTGGLIVTPANADPSYKELVEAFVAKRFEIGGDNLPQHTYMVGLKNMISDAVYTWATTKSTYTDAQFSEFDSNPNDGIQDGLKEFCKLLAWSGLMETTAFDELYPEYPPNPARELIEHTIYYEGNTSPNAKGIKASTLTCND